jgi:hypothetical protein
MSKAGEIWGTLDAAAKAPYEKLAAADKARYVKEMASYTPAEDDGDSKKKRFVDCLPPIVWLKLCSAKKDPNAPKRPLSAYFIYLGEQREEIKKTCSSIGDVCVRARCLVSLIPAGGQAGLGPVERPL